MPKTLYLTDLDGTLLNRQRRLSPFTVSNLNRLIEEGLCFSYATARSIYSASQVTKGLRLHTPVICFNGTFICDPASKKILASECFTPEQLIRIEHTLRQLDISPMVYSMRGGEEKVTRKEGMENQNEGARYYLESRPGDQRQRTAQSEQDLYGGEVFHFTLIGSREELLPAAETFSQMSDIASVFFQELDRPEYWCELMPLRGQKSFAAQKLKEMLGCDRIVAFGDAVNDLPLFQAADEGYAVANAVSQLKAAATGVIGSNESDGVVRWLLETSKKCQSCRGFDFS